MNSLSLRINSVKHDENRKKTHQGLIKIEIEDFWSEDLKQQLTLINDSTTTESQFREIKNFANFISSSNEQSQPEINEKITSCLVRIYFEEKIKHPVKSIIQSCLNQADKRVINELHYSMQDVVIERMNAIDSASTEDRYHFISCLNEASQNFLPAMRAIGHQVEAILPFIKNLIQVYDDQLKTELSPAQKNEVSHQLHCSLQAAIFCAKNCLILNKPSKVNLRLGLALYEIRIKCLELFDHPDLPMDTKNICSILVILQSTSSNNSDFFNWINDPTSSYSKKLSLIFGIITTIDPEQFPVDFSILAKVSTILQEIYTNTSVDPTLLMSVCRSFMQLTKRLASLLLNDGWQMFDTLKHLNVIASSALYVAFLNVEHHMDSVRHLSRESVRNLLEFSEKNQISELSEKIFKEIEKLPSINLKCVTIVSIVPVIKATQILERFARLLRDILFSITDNKAENQNLVNCYEAVANKLADEISFDRWFPKIVQPALDHMNETAKLSEERLTIENLLLKFIKKDNKVFEEILKRRNNFDVGFVLMCLNVGNKAGRFDKNVSTNELWKGSITFEEIKSAMMHIEDKVRNSALLLIVETKKTTEGFTAQELDCVNHFFKYNINVQCPSTRQAILGMIKNLFVRIQNVLQAANKKKDDLNNEVTLKFYFDFLVQLQEFALENLVDGANFTRRTLSLLILNYIVKVIRLCFPEQSSQIWDQEKINVLMNVIHDSYEANKENVIEILKVIPVDVVRKYYKVDLNELHAAVTSIRPPDSLTAIYLIEIHARFTFNFEDFQEEKVEVLPEFFLMLTWCEKNLITGLELAEKSLTVASNTNPLYGLIQSIRHLLLKLDFKLLGSCQPWRDFFRRLITICKRLTQVVAPVVNNSSPEGILPDEDFDDLDEETREKWKNISAQSTPQIILLCSWRTIKEVSLMLGDISLRAPLLRDGNGLLDEDQIISIGDHFIELLSQTKHRGAFEQCFFGFSQVCLRLWACDEPVLHRLPQDMLKQMMNAIAGNDESRSELLSMKNLCATRRSAGLPFMMQALITSELKVAKNESFHFVMKNLILYCKENQNLETRTHSMNVMRALFRCSDLNEGIGEYISDGIKTAILGYGAESWLEKNSATLLFAALMVRIFGVQRTKDSEELDIKNKMRARIFFLRYADLYDFFMTQLKEASQYVLNVRMNSKLQPILLLLNRLYPSALEGTQTKLELVNFIPVVSLCSGCVELPTRVLCAKFIANVTPPHLLIPRILETIKVLKDSERIPANAAHGILLQILHLVKLIPPGNPKQFTPILEEICSIRDRFKRQLICFGTFIDIVIETCLKAWLVLELPSRDPNGSLEFPNVEVPHFHETTLTPDERDLVNLPIFQDSRRHMEALISPQHLNPQNSESDYKKFMRYLKSCFDYDKSTSFGSSLVSSKVLLVQLMMLHLGDPTELFSSIDLKSPEKDFSFRLNVILLLLDWDYALSMQDEYEITRKEIFVIKHFPDRRRESLKRQISTDKNLKVLLAKLPGPEYHLMVKAYDALSLMEHSENENDLESAVSLITIAMRQPEQLKKSLLKFANAGVKKCDFLSQLDFKFLLEISTDSSYYVKMSASDFIETIAKNLKGIKTFDTVLYFAQSLLLLLMDDEPDIRERNSQLVMELVGQSKQNTIPLHAQSLFIEFLMEKLDNFDKYEAMALVMLIVVDGGDGDNCLDDNITEYRVFDKKEVNIFSETFMVKSECSKALKKKLLNEEDITKVILASQKFTVLGDISAIENFLKTLIAN